MECHDDVCLEHDKSLRAVAQAVLWHYSQQRGMLLMLTNTGERGSFTIHPLSKVPILHQQQRRLPLLQGHVCIQLRQSQILERTVQISKQSFFLKYKHTKQKKKWFDFIYPSIHPSINSNLNNNGSSPRQLTALVAFPHLH